MIIAPYLQLDYKKYGIKKIFYFEESSLTIFPPAFHNLPYATVTITPKEKKKKKKSTTPTSSSLFATYGLLNEKDPLRKKKNHLFTIEQKTPKKKFQRKQQQKNIP